MINNKIIGSIETLAGNIDDVTKTLEKELHDYFLPLRERSAIILGHNMMVADAYYELFGTGKTYLCSNDFYQSISNGTVLDNLNINNPLVLVTSIKLPIDNAGKFSDKVYEATEGILLANQVRKGITGFQKDIPIIFYATKIDTATREEIEKLPGLVACVEGTLANNPKKAKIAEILTRAAESMIENKYKNLFQSSNTFIDTYKKFNKK